MTLDTYMYSDPHLELLGIHTLVVPWLIARIGNSFVFCCCYAALTVSSMSEKDMVVGVVVNLYGCEIKVGDGKSVNV